MVEFKGASNDVILFTLSIDRYWSSFHIQYELIFDPRKQMHFQQMFQFRIINIIYIALSSIGNYFFNDNFDTKDL